MKYASLNAEYPQTSWVFIVNFCPYVTMTCWADKIMVGRGSTRTDPWPIEPLSALLGVTWTNLETVFRNFWHKPSWYFAVLKLESLVRHCNMVTWRWRHMWRHQKCRLRTKMDILIKAFRKKTRKPSYRNDDRAMRPIYECPEKFRESLTLPMAIFPEIFNWLFLRVMLWICVPNFLARSFTGSWDICGTPKNWTVHGYTYAPFSPKFLMGFCSDGPCECSGQIWSR